MEPNANASALIAQMSNFTLRTFTSPVSFKLDEENYFPWRHQALACIKANKLKNHFDRSKVPARYATEEDRAVDKETQEYLDWEQQDQHLVSWLLASMDSNFTNRMVKCEFAHEIWSELEKYFAAHTKSKIKQLKTQLNSMKKTSTSNEYLLKIKRITDSLAALGAPVSNEDLVEVVLEGLDEDYSAFMTMVMSRAEPFIELEALLIAQEDIIEKFRKTKLGSVQAHVAQSTENAPKIENGVQVRRGGYGGRRGRGRGFRGGRSWSNSGCPQCQLCGRIGHIVWQCYHWFDQSFQSLLRISQAPPPPSSPFHNPALVSHPPRAYLATPAIVIDEAWSPDSGASHHLTFDQQNLIIGTEYNGPQ